MPDGELDRFLRKRLLTTFIEYSVCTTDFDYS
jgi:hypothetical protein